MADNFTYQKQALDTLFSAPMQKHMFASAGCVFVNGSAGNNSNDGLSRDKSLLTLTAAIAKQTDENKHLYIFVERFYQPTGESWPIVVDKDNVHIIGEGQPGGTWTFIKPDSDVAGIRFDADRCEIAGFEIGGGGTSGAIEFGAYSWGTLIRNCWFGVTNTTQGRDGIWTEGGLGYHTYYTTIIDCIFGKNLTRDGIRLESDASSMIIGMPNHGNIFKDFVGKGIYDNGGFMPDGIVCDNIFAMPADTAGDAIHSESARTLFNGNKAFYGRTAMSNNPYVDTGTGYWGLNYRQGVSILPATV